MCVCFESNENHEERKKHDEIIFSLVTNGDGKKEKRRAHTKKKTKKNLHFLLFGGAWRREHAKQNRTSIKEKVNEHQAVVHSSNRNVKW